VGVVAGQPGAAGVAASTDSGGGDPVAAATGGTPAPGAVASAAAGQASQPAGGAQHAAGGAAHAASSTAASAQNAAITCAAGRNGGASGPGVTDNELHIASTIVTTGVGSGFLGEAVDGMQAAVNEANSSGGVCGRHIVLDTVNDGWDASTGNQDIQNFINSGNYFALVGEPDSEGLNAAVQSGTIDRAGIPVVGTDGMLASQYFDANVFPVAASTVTNMHIVAQQMHAKGAKKVGIVFDNVYKFGAEGATAFAAEFDRLGGGQSLDASSDCGHGYCGVDPSSSSYTTQINAFDGYCNPCDAVVMLLEPQPMLTWMRGEENAPNAWYNAIYGGEPLFDDSFAATCGQDCNQLTVWTGYHAAVQPFDGEAAVSHYVQSLHAAFPNADAHNEFTEGAYLGTQLFVQACRNVNAAGKPLTRDNLRAELGSLTFTSGLAQDLRYASLPHIANVEMAAFSANTQGSFNGWNYLATGFVRDPAPGQDFRR
jgi:ABC-type branched-subunit amino acid transport system substrate-binding protein